MAKKERDYPIHGSDIRHEKNREPQQMNVADDLLGLKDAAMGETGPDVNATPDPPAAAESAPKVDAETGQISGKGFEQQATPEPEIIHLPKKIVAKEIIPRGKLKGGKTWVPEKDPVTGQPYNNGKGEWVLDEPRQLYTVFGTASSTKSGNTTYGGWVAFIGAFEAVRAEDGVRFKSNVLILQQPAEGLLLNALQDAKTRDKDASLSFAFNVGLRTSQRWADSNEGTSYEFIIDSVINVERTDPLAHLRHSLSSLLPKPVPRALPAPPKS